MYWLAITRVPLSHVAARSLCAVRLELCHLELTASGAAVGGCTELVLHLTTFWAHAATTL